MRLGVVNTKGGVGKTTTCVYLAAAAHRRGLSVEVQDLDKQGSATSWLSGVTGVDGLAVAPGNKFTVSRDSAADVTIYDTSPGDPQDVELVGSGLTSWSFRRLPVHSMTSARCRRHAISRHATFRTLSCSCSATSAPWQPVTAAPFSWKWLPCLTRRFPFVKQSAAHQAHGPQTYSAMTSCWMKSSRRFSREG